MRIVITHALKKSKRARGTAAKVCFQIVIGASNLTLLHEQTGVIQESVKSSKHKDLKQQGLALYDQGLHFHNSVFGTGFTLST